MYLLEVFQLRNDKVLSGKIWVIVETPKEHWHNSQSPMAYRASALWELCPTQLPKSDAITTKARWDKKVSTKEQWQFFLSEKNYKASDGSPA